LGCLEYFSLPLLLLLLLLAAVQPAGSFWHSAGNSFGIFPTLVRDAVSKQVQDLLTDDGVFIAGFW